MAVVAKNWLTMFTVDKYSWDKIRGDYNVLKRYDLSLDDLKKPNFFNKLGFEKKGYYEVYLVVDAEGCDYHWYRQDKGGYWSQKHGLLPVDNVDG